MRCGGASCGGGGMLPPCSGVMWPCNEHQVKCVMWNVDCGGASQNVV